MTPSPRDRLAHLGSSERLGERGLMIPELSFGVELGGTHYQTLTGNDIGDHLCRGS